MDDATKPLRSRLLAVPSLRRAYLEKVRTIASEWLDWEKLRPVAQSYHDLIAEEVAKDTRKLSSTQAFERSLEGATPDAQGGRAARMTLREFCEKRRAFLLAHPEIKALEDIGG